MGEAWFGIFSLGRQEVGITDGWPSCVLPARCDHQQDDQDDQITNIEFHNVCCQKSVPAFSCCCCIDKTMEFY
jgi:hypothetical protein